MSRPWMPLYVADYLADTGHLNAAEHGAYLLLIMHYWQKGNLPDDDRRLASIARALPEHWLSMRDTIAEFFGPGWTHARIDEELAEAEEKYRKRAEAGRKGGKAKAEPEHCSSNASSNAKARLNQPQPQASSKQEGANAPSARANDDEFDDWYSRYPHKVQRGAAEKAFRSARKIASLEALILGLHRYIATKPDDRHWQNPATWLNGKGWLDEPAGPPIRNANWPPGQPPPKPPRNAGEAARLELKRRGEYLDAPSPETRHLDEGDGSPGFAGTGIARRIALAAGG